MQIEPFETERLLIENWKPSINDPDARRVLEAELAVVLSPSVLAHLPPSLELDDRDGAITSWVDARDAESVVLMVRSADDARLIGLVILAPEMKEGALQIIHVGYLLSETEWGRGVGSEVMTGLVRVLHQEGPIRLVGGVSPANPGSVRVLQKAGFVRDADMSGAQVDVYLCDIGYNA